MVRRKLDPTNWVGYERRADGSFVNVPVENVFGDGIEVEDIRVDTSVPGHNLVVLVRALGRPDCSFGFRFGVFEDWGEEGLWDPEGYATVIWANVDEKINALGYGLPKDCLPNDVTWIHQG